MIEPCLDRLKYAVQALALPSETQLHLFPDFVCKADELALDFCNGYETILNQLTPGLTTRQIQVLNALDKLLNSISGENNSPLWTDDALRTDPSWAKVRDLAQEVLAAFGWPLDVPPTYRSNYIKGASS